ncbi:hypothetical protein F2P81_010262 [Scophthalmus maximus]|uniref:Uncharacterized protein n=1 Tax=Scophthalmus maximus TaxID=52904 RepID=A0A6A4SZC3_SCOMX|nr:hypothetical protein F2P81_010262 [Scophthalmus maximus]
MMFEYQSKSTGLVPLADFVYQFHMTQRFLDTTHDSPRQRFTILVPVKLRPFAAPSDPQATTLTTTPG